MTAHNLTEILSEKTLNHWLPRVDILLCRFQHPVFDDLTNFDASLRPANQLVTLFQSINAGATDQEIAAALSSLPIFTWHVRHPVSNMMWSPLESSLSTYLLDTEDYPIAWHGENPYPDREDIQEWLMGFHF